MPFLLCFLCSVVVSLVVALGLFVCWAFVRAPVVLCECAYVMLCWAFLLVSFCCCNLTCHLVVGPFSFATFNFGDHWILFANNRVFNSCFEFSQFNFWNNGFRRCRLIFVMWQHFLSRVGAVGSPLFHGMPWNFSFEPPTPPTYQGIWFGLECLPPLLWSECRPSSILPDIFFLYKAFTYRFLRPRRRQWIPPNE